MTNLTASPIPRQARVALDRAVKSIERHGMSGPLSKWKKPSSTIRADVPQHGFNARLGSFVSHYGSKRLDASVLLLPIVGFLQADDPRMLGTIRALERIFSKTDSCCVISLNPAKANRAHSWLAASGS